jgi:hypothetical protein
MTAIYVPNLHSEESVKINLVLCLKCYSVVVLSLTVLVGEGVTKFPPLTCFSQNNVTSVSDDVRQWQNAALFLSLPWLTTSYLKLSTTVYERKVSNTVVHILKTGWVRFLLPLFLYA